MMSKTPIRTPHSVALVMLAILSCTGLSACTPEQPSTPTPSATVEISTPIPTPSTSWTPEQQAVIDTVQAYLTKWNEISQDPAAHDLEEIREYAIDPMASVDISVWSGWKEHGWHWEGSPIFTPEQVDLAMTDASGQHYTVYGCYSIIGSDLLDQDGKSLSDSGRRDISGSMYTTLVNADGQFVMDGKDVDWSC